MSLEQPEMSDETADSEHDDRGSLAIAAGLGAALVGGGLWALLVRATSYEIGYAAVAVGFLVGWAMTRVSRSRSTTLAATAATLALVGLVAGKLFIFFGSTGALASDLLRKDDALRGTVAWLLYEERSLESATLEEVDATLASGDTLSDALWMRMTGEAGSRLESMAADAREAMATRAAKATLARIGPVRGVLTQLSFFDVLWVVLAVGTAYRMLLPVARTEPEPLQPA